MIADKGQIRIYRQAECITFRSTKERFGGLSNMAGGYPLRVNGIEVLSSEALYQACRFPDLPDIQRLIIEQKSPMTAKMVGKPHRDKTRPDWMQIRVRVMRWVLRVKLAMHWPEFGGLLLETGDTPIVEDSRRDDYWGALRQEDGTLVGMNVLGRLLMELREELRGPGKDALRIVDPPPLPDFLLYGEPIRRVGFAKADAQIADPDASVRPDTLWASPPPAIADSELVNDDPVPVAHGKASDDKPMTYPKRLIEVDLPIKRISAHARREKSIRHGHIATLHIWWARRPLASCRAVICAALWPDPADEHCPQRFREGTSRIMAELRQRVLNGKISNDQRAAREPVERIHVPENTDDYLGLRRALLDFIAEFANWGLSTNRFFLNASRALTQSAHEALGGAPGTRPLVVDPFAGGGAIPLEALRVGASAFASDLNPVAVLINKVVLEYIPKYGQRLADEVRKWGQWVKNQAEKELSAFYPKDQDGAIPIAYVWARTVRCEGPGCGAEVPLIRSLWLAKKGKKSIAMRMLPRPRAKRVDFEIIEAARASDVGVGTVARGSATCPCCGFTTPVGSVRKQLTARMGGAADSRMLAVVLAHESKQGRFYRCALKTDIDAAARAASHLERTNLRPAGHSPVPDEPLPIMSGVFNAPIYGHSTWGSLFTPRQALSLVTLCSLVRKAGTEIRRGHDAGLAVAVETCLALAIDKQADSNSSLCAWRATSQDIGHTFGRQALPMMWDFVEANVLSGSTRDWSNAIEGGLKALESLDPDIGEGHAEAASATKHPLPDDSANCFVTDPPYYNAVPYADLSDFFYVWLKRTIPDLYPELFAEPLSPKKDECCEMAGWDPERYPEKNGHWFEQQIGKAMAESRRVLAPNGIGTVVFAHKSTGGWEAVLQAMIDAGWTVTASWPIDTEMGSRLRAINSAVLASSIHLVCRPRENPDGSVRTAEIGDWREVLAELPNRIHEWMPRLANEGVVGADAIFACLGPALEIFSRYSRVEKASGEQVSLRDYLEQVWAAVSQEALRLVFEKADASGFEEDARLTAMWLWTLSTGNSEGKMQKAEVEDEEHAGEEEPEDGRRKKKANGGFALEYDAARKIAQGLGAHLENLGTVVEIDGDTARLLPVSERTKALFGKDQADAPTGKRKKKDKQMKLAFAEELEQAESEGGWGEKGAPKVGTTTLDRVHQSMILFAAGRSEAMKRFLVEEGVGRDGRFWTLADCLSKLYPPKTDEKRWVDGLLARKKGLGF